MLLWTICLETIKKNIRGKSWLILQKETFYIYHMQATVYLGLNVEIYVSPFLSLFLSLRPAAHNVIIDCMLLIIAILL